MGPRKLHVSRGNMISAELIKPMKMVAWNLLLILISYLAAVIAHEFGDGIGRYAECGSEKVNWPVRSSNVMSSTRTKRQSPEPIRIFPYYVTANISSVEAQLRADNGPVAYTLNYFRRTLSVIPFQGNIRAPEAGAMCSRHVTIPNEHAETGVANADYLYYITAVNDEICQGGFIVAYAGACYVERSMNNRPYIGFVNYCPTAFTRFSTSFINALSLHEITHALVFSPFLFRWFPSFDNVVSQTRIDGQDVSMIITPKVVQAARDHYNCSTLTGPLLENEGGELSRGSHWESRTLFPELMNGLIYDSLANTTVISRITLSLFEDSGWYTVNYEAGLSNEELLSGSNEGCDFVTASCNSTSYPYACTTCCELRFQCTYDYQAAGTCQQHTFFDSCPVLIPLSFCTDDSESANAIPVPSGIIADRGPQSICMASNNPNPSATVVANCVVRRCVQIQGTDLIAFSLTFNGQIEWCYPNGTVNNGQLQCPPVRYACARGEVDMLSPTDDPIPPPLCDASCGSCTVAQNPAFCQTCVAGTLNGFPPSSCLADSNPCTGNTYLSSGEGCVECPAGCSLCTGPMNSECLACEDTELYRDTTNRLRNPCVIRCGLGMIESIDVFGVRTCVEIERRDSGVMRALTGVSSIVVMLAFITTVIMNI